MNDQFVIVRMTYKLLYQANTSILDPFPLLVLEFLVVLKNELFVEIIKGSELLVGLILLACVLKVEHWVALEQLILKFL